MVRRLNAEGAQLDGIHYLRALGNAESLRRDAEQAERVVCVGGSYIGCEAAASLTAMGKRCTVVMLEAEPLERGFGARAGRWFRELLETHGVEVVGEASVEAFTRRRARRGVQLDDGAFAGGRRRGDRRRRDPDVMLARKSGLEIGDTDGVRCDATLRTSADGVYAAGDMCEYASPLHDGRHVRIEHEDHAERQGETAARNMLGARRASIASSRTSSPTSPTGRRSSTSAAAPSGTRRSSTAHPRRPLLGLVPRRGRVRGVLDVNGHGDLDARPRGDRLRRLPLARRDPRLTLCGRCVDVGGAQRVRSAWAPAWAAVAEGEGDIGV